MSTVTKPGYGASEHYLGDKGQDYFAWQNAGAAFAAQIIAHRFRPFIKPSDTVVDFGCGGGYLLKNLECARKMGVEINPVARRHAIDELGIECHAAVQDVPDEIADVIISNHALEHVEFPIGALRELRAKLKPGGKLVLCVPIDNWRLQKRYDPKDANHHLHTWTTQLLGNTLTEAGFEVGQIKYRIHSWIPGWTVFTYGRFPFWMFNTICYLHGVLTGKGRELLAKARRVDG